MKFSDAFTGSAPFSDWASIKAQILAGLDLVQEYREMGLRIVGPPRNGKVEARAMGREDASPSAFVSLDSGLYYASGNPPELLSFFDFAIKYGGYDGWDEAVRHFAGKAGVPISFRRNYRGWIEEAIYTYRDRAGAVAYEVIRYRRPDGRKAFSQRRPDPNTSGAWIYSMDGVDRVLYRLPDLLSRPDQPVWLVEGEKDVESLVSLGLLATTAPQGAEAAGLKYWELGCYAADLRGRDVIIVPDNDPPGAAFARCVARKLHGVAARVRLVTLPGLPPKGDVTDWLDQGYGVAELRSIVADWPDYNPDTAPPIPDDDLSRDATAADLVAANAGTRWLWEGWIPLSVLTLLTAEPSTGKTRFCLDLNKRIANGLPWPDGTPLIIPDGMTSRVLWIAADNQHAELADAPSRFGFDADRCLLNTTVGDLYGGTELQEDEQLEDLEARIRRTRPALVIIDTVTNTSDRKSQDTSDAKRQYKPLQEIAKRTGAAIMCVTHLNVAGRTLGRRADEKTRLTIRMEHPDPEGQPSRRKLSVALSRLSVYPPPLGVTMADDGNTYDKNPPEPRPVEVEANGTKPTALDCAVNFLRDRLAVGPARVHHVREDAERHDPPISAKTLYRAVRHASIEEFELDGRKWWRWPVGVNGHAANCRPPA